MSDRGEGESIYALAERLWSLPRSISGEGLRQTLRVLGEYAAGLDLIEVPSGTPVFDWIVPEEWSIRSARLLAPNGDCIADFAENNLHVVGYSSPVDAEFTLEQLQDHLHSLPDQPDAIPYVTAYYRRTWGFCIPHRVREGLRPGRYLARIDASHAPGSITLGEWRLAGRETREVLLSTYCCHPSLANNELSGPCVAAHLARWLASRPRRLSYRVVFLPEMIGSLAYLSSRHAELRERTIAGFVLTCLGDERGWSFLPSREGNTLADRLGRHVLRHHAGGFREYDWNDRGSDESNYCAPGIDLPVVSLMRSKYREYPEYHTSLDRLGTVVTPRGLGESFELYRRVIEALESECTPHALVLGEPQLGRRGLYPEISTPTSTRAARSLLDVISQCDGKQSLLQIAERCHLAHWDVVAAIDRLQDVGLVRR